MMNDGGEMKNVTISIEIFEKDFFPVYRSYCFYKTQTRTLLLVFSYFLLTLLYVGSTLSEITSESAQTAAFFILLLFYPGFFSGIFTRPKTLSTESTKDSIFLGESSWSFEEDSLIVKNPLFTIHLSWENFENPYEITDYYILIHKKRPVSWVFLPKRVFNGSFSEIEFRDLLLSKVGNIVQIKVPPLFPLGNIVFLLLYTINFFLFVSHNFPL
jgi:hypothetical protein